MKPRLLRLLRVEDEKVYPQGLAVRDLGRIDKWARFVRGLAKNGLILADSAEEGLHAIDGKPDVVAIDFKFWEDTTLPRNPENRGDWRDAKDFDAGWSDHLGSPSTGILIGATVVTWAVQSDLPVLMVMHTGAAPDFARDVPTVALLGQMFAMTGASFPEDVDAFTATRDYLSRLPKTHEPAIREKMEDYRAQLLARLCDRLFIVPGSTIDLLHAFDSAKTQEELDQVLHDVGLNFVDRDGVPHCLDLRSVFLDLVPRDRDRDPTRDWGMLPLHAVKVEKRRAGQVLAFVQKVTDLVDKVFIEAAEHVRYNSKHFGPLASPKKFPGRDKRMKLMALMFAAIEEAVPSGETALKRMHVLGRLGYWPEKGPSHEIPRILERAFDVDSDEANTFMTELVKLRMPKWMAAPFVWYMKQYHSDLKKEKWPAFEFGGEPYDTWMK